MVDDREKPVQSSLSPIRNVCVYDGWDGMYPDTRVTRRNQQQPEEEEEEAKEEV